MKCVQEPNVTPTPYKRFKDLNAGDVVLNSSCNLCLVTKPYNCGTGHYGLVKLDTGEFYKVTDTCSTKYEVVQAQVTWKRKPCT